VDRKSVTKKGSCSLLYADVHPPSTTQGYCLEASKRDVFINVSMCTILAENVY
jgi:hypothetical protein